MAGKSRKFSKERLIAIHLALNPRYGPEKVSLRKIAEDIGAALSTVRYVAWFRSKHYDQFIRFCDGEISLKDLHLLVAGKKRPLFKFTYEFTNTPEGLASYQAMLDGAEHVTMKPKELMKLLFESTLKNFIECGTLERYMMKHSAGDERADLY